MELRRVLHGMIFELPHGRSALEVPDGMDAKSVGPLSLETNRGRRRLQRRKFRSASDDGMGTTFHRTVGGEAAIDRSGERGGTLCDLQGL